MTVHGKMESKLDSVLGVLRRKFGASSEGPNRPPIDLEALFGSGRIEKKHKVGKVATHLVPHHAIEGAVAGTLASSSCPL